MHVFIGGAYNGKRKYVAKWLEEQGVNDVAWFDGALPVGEVHSQTIVVSYLERLLETLDLANEEEVALYLFTELKKWDRTHRLVVVLSDMGRGVVPFEPKTRQLRDVCGRLYQLLFQDSEGVTRIWYGLAEKLK